MLEVLDCAKSYLLGLCQKLLRVKNHLNLKCFCFYKFNPGIRHVLVLYSLSAREDLESFLSAKSLPAETELLGKLWTF
jgi:hypothetical protein